MKLWQKWNNFATIGCSKICFDSTYFVDSKSNHIKREFDLTVHIVVAL